MGDGRVVQGGVVLSPNLTYLVVTDGCTLAESYLPACIQSTVKFGWHVRLYHM